MNIIPNQITASGGTLDNYVFSEYANLYLFSSGAITLTSSFSITPSTNVSGAFFTVRWNANVTLGGFTTTICGITINQDQLNQTGTFECYYDGSAWSVQYFADGTDLPQNAQGYTSVSVLVSGTLTLTAGASTVNQRLVGPTVLAGNYNVTAGTSGVKAGSEFMITIGGGVTIGSNTFTVFGQSISASDALNGGALVIATFDEAAGVWRSIYVNKEVAINQLASIAALSVIANATNASAIPTAVSAASNGGVFMRRSNALGFNPIASDNFTSSTDTLPLKYLAVTINSANVLTSFATPVNILNSTTAGGLPIIQSVLFGMSSGGSAYSSHTNIGIRPVGGSDDICSYNGALAISGTDFYALELIPNAPAVGGIVFGNDIEFYTKTGNPTGGTRSVLLMIIYTVIPAP
jgi:hypothetical protein